MIEQTIKDLIKTAMKSNDSVAKNILRLALGQIQLDASSGVELTEDQKLNVLKKLIKSNQQTIDGMNEKSDWTEEWKENHKTLILEMDILQKLVPQSWSEDQVRTFLTGQGIDIKSVGNVGKAIGMCMKSLKSVNAPIDPVIVKKVVEDLLNAG